MTEFTVTEGLTCPKCGAQEAVPDPTSPTGLRFNIRAYRVEIAGVWSSQCMICAEAGDKGKGWFS